MGREGLTSSGGKVGKWAKGNGLQMLTLQLSHLLTCHPRSSPPSRNECRAVEAKMERSRTRVVELGHARGWLDARDRTP